MSDQLDKPAGGDEALEAFIVALSSQGWPAGPAGEYWFRLAGGSVDLNAHLVTDCFVVPGNISLETRLAVRMPPEKRAATMAMCSLLNAAGIGNCALDRDNVPVVHYKSLLFGHGNHTAAVVVDAIRVHRAAIVDLISPAFTRVVNGEDVSAIAEGLELETALPFARPFRAAVFDRSSMPEPNPDAIKLWRERIPESSDEADALAALWALNNALPDDAFVCVGPVVAHVDGTLECYACETPNNSYHPSGTSGSCTDEYRPGTGHECPRCKAIRGWRRP